MEDAKVTTPPVDGLRRVRKLPPQLLPHIQGGGGPTATQTKRARRQEEEEESPKEVSHDGDETNVGDQVNSEASEASESSMVLRSAATGRSGVSAFENSAEEQEAHPCLFIDTILDVVFKHIINQPGPRTVMAGDVRNIRLVCKTWATFITRLYRQTRPGRYFRRYDERRRGGPRLTSLTAFVRTMKFSQMIPMQNFTFFRSCFSKRNPKMFKEFLRICGPEVVVLTMSIDWSSAERIMLTLENLPLLEMKRLKTLNFDICEDQPGQYKLEDNALMKLLELLLTSANTLHGVKVCYNYYGVDSEQYRRQLDVVVQQLSRSIARSIPRTVKKLELFMKMDEAAVNNLMGMQAKLEMITLWILPGSGRGTYKFLQSQASTLKYLQFGRDSSKHLVEFPRLDELIKLEVRETTVSVTSRSHFAETFPKLHSLKMNGNVISTLLSTVKKPCESLKVLDMTRWSITGIICPASLVKKIAQSFPCLAELRITVREGHNETIEEVFKYLDNLESLHISFYGFNHTAYCLDSLLSGIPEADCNLIGGLQDVEAVNWNELRRQPSIVNLKKLRTLDLDIHHMSPTHQIGFTNVSAHSVFLEMNNLCKIQIENAVALLSRRYLELLRDKLVLRGSSYIRTWEDDFNE